MAEQDLTAAQASSGASAQTAAAPAADPDERRRKMSYFMVGSAGAILLGSFLPWASTPVESASGVTALVGWITAASGVGLGLYGLQGLQEEPRIRFHGWALTALSLSFFFGFVAFATIDDLGGLSGGAVSVGTGLWLVVIGTLAAIYPFVQLRKDGRQREREREQAVQAQAGWHPDPTERYEQRYYDGVRWTEHVAKGGEQHVDPLQSGGSAA